MYDSLRQYSVLHRDDNRRSRKCFQFPQNEKRKKCHFIFSIWSLSESREIEEFQNAHRKRSPIQVKSMGECRVACNLSPFVYFCCLAIIQHSSRPYRDDLLGWRLITAVMTESMNSHGISCEKTFDVGWHQSARFVTNKFPFKFPANQGKHQMTIIFPVV